MCIYIYIYMYIYIYIYNNNNNNNDNNNIILSTSIVHYDIILYPVGRRPHGVLSLQLVVIAILSNI